MNSKLLILLRDWRVRLLLACFLLLGVAPLAINGLDFGTDFTGGSIIQLKLEKPVDEITMSTMTTVLENRLNGFGLRDLSVKPWGDEYVVVEVAEQEKAELDVLKDLLSRQGRFEATIDGEIVLRSKDLAQVLTNPQKGYGYLSSTGEWRVPFVISPEGSTSFAKSAKGKCIETADGVECQRIYMFIDRPENAALVMPTELYAAESSMALDPLMPGSYQVSIEEFEHNSLVKIFSTDDPTEIIDELSEYEQVIIPEDYDQIIVDALKAAELNVIVKSKAQHHWLWSATNLNSVLFLTPGVTDGTPQREATITGRSDNVEDAIAEMTEMVVLLKSGRLPVSISIESTMSVSPSLGQNFLKDSIWIGLLVLCAVAFVVFLRYRNPVLTAAIMVNDVFEVVIILGIASIINWQIDMSAMAGLIAVLGTGVDHLIVITDEAVYGLGKEETTLATRIKGAFSIIFVAAATTVLAMFPLMTLGLGMLKGFAITTIIGVFVGVVLVRPVFAKVIEQVV